MILELIKLIDLHWEQKSSLFDINPNDFNGYFSFRNKIIQERGTNYETKFD